MNSENILELDKTAKIYRRSHLGKTKETRGALDITFSIQKGEVFGLLGLNGAGKTTIIKLVLGLIFPTSGRIQVMGKSPEDPLNKKQIGYLPEVPYFYKFLTAREVLSFYGRISGLPSHALPNRIEDALRIVRMQDHSNRPMREYSKGMLQRIGLAQAILHDPPLMLFDEPVTGLDPMGLKEMRDLLVSLNKNGKTIFFSSHSISEAEKVCHRVGIMVKGRLEKIVSKNEWEGQTGSLEKIFVDTITSKGGISVG